MASALWSGLLSAGRYAVPCPRCGDVTARVDSDSLGRTMVSCKCAQRPFPMPLTRGGPGAAWPVDLSGVRDASTEYVPEKPRLGIRLPGISRCHWGDLQPDESCDVGVNGRSIFCPKHSPRAMTMQFPCPTDGCTGTRTYRAKTCSRCAYERRLAARRVGRDGSKDQFTLELL